MNAALAQRPRGKSTVLQAQALRLLLQNLRDQLMDCRHTLDLHREALAECEKREREALTAIEQIEQAIRELTETASPGELGAP